MGQLKRARSTEAKEARRAAILRTTRDLFEKSGYDAITIADVARRSRLAKGTVFLYFATKEVLFLDLFEESQAEWLGALHEVVALDDKPWPSARLARVITDSLAERPALLRLMPIAALVLIPGVGEQRATEFRYKLLRRFFGIGSLVEQRLDLARAGDGVPLLMFAQAMIVGLAAGEDLRTALTVLFNGFHRKTAG
jgi:AcrR family transcriptional regulator